MMPTAMVCPRCRQPARPGMAFCGNCGYSLAATAMPPMNATPMPGVTPYAAPAAPPRRSSCGKVLLVGLLAFVVLGAVVGIGSWFFISRALTYTPPARRAPKLPPQTATSFKELPLDTDANAPTQPGSVMTQSFPPGAGTSAAPKVPQTWLPPGLDRASLPRRAGTLTSATYRPRSTTSGSRDSIYIHVLVPPANQTANAAEMTTAITQAMRGEKSAVRFQNAKGEVYAGSRIRAQEKTVYVLEKQNSNTVIIIYAPNQTMQAAAERLAATLGNGEGLNDYPDTQTSLWTLPAEPPGDLTLQEANTLTGDDLGISGEDIMSGGGDAQTRETLAQIRGFIPERLTAARYHDRTRREWNAMVFDYGSVGRAWRNWQLLRWTVGMTSMESVPVLGGQGLHVENDGQRILITQKGPYLIILAGPGAASLESLVGLANTFQI